MIQQVISFGYEHKAQQSQMVLDHQQVEEFISKIIIFFIKYVDHTTQTDHGYYLYIETSHPQISGQKARIISPMYSLSSSSSSVCFRFYYHMFGSSIGTLNFLMTSTKQILWTKRYSIENSNRLNIMCKYFSGNLGNQWRYGHVTVRSNNSYQVAFEGVVGTNFQVTKFDYLNEYFD